jgi:hypothetical protein
MFPYENNKPLDRMYHFPCPKRLVHCQWLFPRERVNPMDIELLMYSDLTR